MNVRLLFLVLIGLDLIWAHNEAYVTALFTEDYKIAVQVLGVSIRNTKTTRDMVVLTSDNISQGTKTELISFGWKIKEVAALTVKYPTRTKWMKNLTKLRIWQLIEYKKVVFVDADMLVLQNIDHLFECPDPICASLDAPVPTKFNAGLMVITPNETIFDALLNLWKEGKEYPDVEQGLLNDFYPLDSLKRENILPFQYNAHSYTDGVGIVYDLSDVKVIHFTTFKPWFWYTLPVGDLGFIWKQFETYVPNSSKNHILIGVVLLVIPWVAIYLVNFIASKFCKKTKNPNIGFLSIWRMVISLFGLALGIYLGFSLIPSSFPYLIGWVILYEWAFAGFWLPIIPELQASIMIGQILPDLSLPRFIVFLEQYGDFMGHWVKGIIYFFLVPLSLIFLGIYVVLGINNYHIVLRMVIFVITLAIALVLNIILAFIGPYLAYSKGREYRSKQGAEIFI